MWTQNITGCLPAPTSHQTGRFLVPSPRCEGWEHTDTRGPAPGEEARREEQMVQATLTWKVSGATDTASQWGCAGGGEESGRTLTGTSGEGGGSWGAWRVCRSGICFLGSASGFEGGYGWTSLGCSRQPCGGSPELRYGAA